MSVLCFVNMRLTVRESECLLPVNILVCNSIVFKNYHFLLAQAAHLPDQNISESEERRDEDSKQTFPQSIFTNHKYR